MTKLILRDFPFPIVTPRLVIAPVRPGTGAEVFEAVEETRESLSRWMAWEKDTKSPDNSEEVVRRAHAQYILREDFMMHARSRETGQILVCTGFHKPDWDINAFEIGYWVRRTAQGQNLATESTNALVRFAFNAMGAKRVVIGHAEGNDASRRVIEKLGFTPESRQIQGCLLPDGSIVDDFRYVRLGTDGLPPLDVSWGQEP